jgi:ABC-type lipoprotein release transport system permease subunit
MLIAYVDPTIDTSFLWIQSGLVIAGILFGLMVLSTFATAMNSMIRRRVTQLINSFLFGVVFEKSLRLSPGSLEVGLIDIGNYIW